VNPFVLLSVVSLAFVPRTFGTRHFPLFLHAEIAFLSCNGNTTEPFTAFFLTRTFLDAYSKRVSFDDYVVCFAYYRRINPYKRPEGRFTCILSNLP